MKNSCILSGFIFCAFFPLLASASDTITVKLPIPLNDKTRLNDSAPFIKSLDRMYSPEIPDYNPLLTYIQFYDIFNNRVHPKPARVIAPDEVLDFPKMSPLFMPLIFNAIRRDYKITWREIEVPQRLLYSASLDSIRTVFHSDRFINNLARSIILSAETQQIDQIKYDQKNLPLPEKLVFQINSHKPATWMKPEKLIARKNPDAINLPKTKYNPWTKNGFAKLQFSQTFISQNWSKGGESNMAGLTTIYLKANYFNLKNVAFDNNVEAKIGINTVSSDSLRNLNVSTDQLRAVSKLGIRMYNDLYYTLSGEFNTQFLNNYKINSMDLLSAFFSPAKLFIGLGVDYKKTDKKKDYTLSILVTPLTCKINYLNDVDKFNTLSYGIKDGHHFGTELGTKITTTLFWKLSDQVQWKSNFYYYTDFTYVDSEWENALDLNLNHYFVTQIFLHLKIDDRLIRSPGEPLLQMQELLSFGLVYRW